MLPIEDCQVQTRSSLPGEAFEKISPPSDYLGLIHSLSRKIDDQLSLLLPEGSSVALLDFSYHANSGDAAIWLGQKQALRRRKAKIVYCADRYLFSGETMTSRLPRDGVILFRGGGTFGDLWQDHFLFRLKVISEFKNYRIVQLPETLYFEDPENLRNAKKVIGSHPDVVLLFRDRRSFEMGRNEFKARSFLCPDMAFSLGPLRRPCEPVQDVLWLRRTDKEATTLLHPEAFCDVEGCDWTAARPTPLSRAAWFLTFQMRLHPRRLAWLSPLIWKTYDRIAQGHLTYGLRLLSRARAVMTDRLHGHVLSLIMGIPSVCLSNSYWKLQAFYETWTKGCEIAFCSDSPVEALQTLRSHRLWKNLFLLSGVRDMATFNPSVAAR